MTRSVPEAGRPSRSARGAPVSAIPYPHLLALPELASLDRFVLETLCRGQVQPIYLGDHTALCRILCRYKFYVDTRDRGFGSNLLLDGFWETWLTQFIAGVVKPGMSVFDVGANFGYFTLLLADLVGPTGKVCAVEPNPNTATYLRNSIMLNGANGWTRVVEAAAGDSEGGTVELFAPPGEPKNSFVVTASTPVDPALGARYPVPAVTIDGLVGAAERLDFVKIDAEGAEAAIIEGMSASLETFRPMLVLEFNAARGEDPAGLFDRLISIYGRARHVDFDGYAIEVSRSQVMSEHFGEDWLLFFGDV